MSDNSPKGWWVGLGALAVRKENYFLKCVGKEKNKLRVGVCRKNCNKSFCINSERMQKVLLQCA